MASTRASTAPAATRSPSRTRISVRMPEVSEKTSAVCSASTAEVEVSRTETGPSSAAFTLTSVAASSPGSWASARASVVRAPPDNSATPAAATPTVATPARVNHLARFIEPPGSLWIERPAWDPSSKRWGTPVVRADAGRFPHRVAARIAGATRSAGFRGEGGPSPHPSPAALRAASAPEGLAPQPAGRPGDRAPGAAGRRADAAGAGGMPGDRPERGAIRRGCPAVRAAAGPVHWRSCRLLTARSGARFRGAARIPARRG